MDEQYAVLRQEASSLTTGRRWWYCRRRWVCHPSWRLHLCNGRGWNHIWTCRPGKQYGSIKKIAKVYFIKKTKTKKKTIKKHQTIQNLKKIWNNLNPFSHHVRKINEGVIDGDHLDAFLKASPQDQTANTTEAVGGREREMNKGCTGKSAKPLREDFLQIYQ